MASMIVSHRYRFIFIAVPRTGIHVVRTAPEPFVGPEDRQHEGLQMRVRSPLPALGHRARTHHPPAGRPHLPEAVRRTYCKLAFTRNPCVATSPPARL